MPVDLEQRVRRLEYQYCQMQKERHGIGLEVLSIQPTAGQTTLYSEVLRNVKVVYVDREGMGLHLLPVNSNDIPSTRQARHIPGAGFLLIDIDAPTSGFEVFSIVYQYTDMHTVS